MIKNERQYRITKAKAEEFAEALGELEQNASGEPSSGEAKTSASEEDVHPVLRKAQEEALRSQHEELREELAAYEALPERSALELSSLGDLPLALVQARIAEGLTQKDLAERLGLKEQQIQRYESTEYASASWQRIREVLEALGAREKASCVSRRASPAKPEEKADAPAKKRGRLGTGNCAKRAYFNARQSRFRCKELPIHTSMSAGDIARDPGGQYWLCALRGWERIEPAGSGEAQKTAGA